MLECKNCGAALQYDIDSGRLVCRHCSSAFDPNESWKERVAAEAEATFGEAVQQDDSAGKDYEITVYTCPQCGGEIASYQNEATEFCSYCGASVTLAGRMAKEKKPTYVVPFSVSRENCLKAYRAHLKALPFVPKELKSEEAEQKFVGIYMPFWLYRVVQKGEVSLEGHRSAGDCTEYCKLNMSLNTVYERICYDASSAFDDTLAQQVAPFDFTSSRAFQPAYLCGFYADRADVDETVYRDKALEEAANRTIQTLNDADYDLRDMKISEKESRKIPGTVTSVESALLPVWFMTWRTADRVSYSVVNGTTQKVAADVPVDRKKYLLASVLLGLAVAAALYFLLPVITPAQSVQLSYLIAVLGLWIYQKNFHARASQESHAEDAGFTGEKAAFRKKKGGISVGHGKGWIFLGIMILFEMGIITAAGAFSVLTGVLFLISLALEGYLHVGLMRDHRLVKDRRMLRDTLPLLVCAILSAVLLIRRPVMDYYYYAVTILIAGSLLNMLMGNIGQYNDLSTRPLPVFHNRKRGDGNV